MTDLEEGRYDYVETAEVGVIYDIENTKAWIQSDYVLYFGEATAEPGEKATE